MKILNKLKQLFSIKHTSIPKHPKTLKDLDILDDVWVKDKLGVIHKGWIFDINKHHLIVLVPEENAPFSEFRFNITRPLSRTELIQYNQTLFLNEPCVSEKLSTFQLEKDL